MMKYLKLLPVVVMVATSAMAAPQKRPISYKCFFELIGGEQIVQQVNSAMKNAKLVAADMQGKTIFAKDGKTKKYIFKVHECVKVSDDFSDVTARQLDKKSVF